MTRQPAIAANWKMHHDHLVAIQVVQKLSFRLEKDDYQACDIIICAPFTDLRTLQTLIEADRIPLHLGAQNCHWENQGAFTGEVSPVMLAKLKVEYVIVGHSERRQLFGETDDIVNRKAKAVLHHEMAPIVCVGETLDEHDHGEAATRVVDQITAAFAGIRAADAERCVVAYEPIWAIGTGRTATPDDAAAIIATIREALRGLVGEAADQMRLQYGGSVKPGNIAELMQRPDIDGALVGGASLDPDDFARIVQYRR
jgi:triosephosphate isomerase (TIM)